MLEYRAELAPFTAKDPTIVMFYIQPREEDREEITKVGTRIKINGQMYEITGSEWFLNNFGRPGSTLILATRLIITAPLKIAVKPKRQLDLG